MTLNIRTAEISTSGIAARCYYRRANFDGSQYSYVYNFFRDISPTSMVQDVGNLRGWVGVGVESCTRSHAISKMTARWAQYVSALKIVCKRKISRRLRKNLQITILSLFGGEIIFEVFKRIWSRYLNVTDGQTDRETDRRHAISQPLSVLSSRGKNRVRRGAIPIHLFRHLCCGGTVYLLARMYTHYRQTDRRQYYANSLRAVRSAVGHCF